MCPRVIQNSQLDILWPHLPRRHLSFEGDGEEGVVARWETSAEAGDCRPFGVPTGQIRQEGLVAPWRTCSVQDQSFSSEV